MAATTSQGKSFTVFIVGITVAAAGLAFSATGIGKVALVAGLAIIAYSFFRFFMIKPLEGPTAEGETTRSIEACRISPRPGRLDRGSLRSAPDPERDRPHGQYRYRPGHFTVRHSRDPAYRRQQECDLESLARQHQSKSHPGAEIDEKCSLRILYLRHRGGVVGWRTSGGPR